MALLFRSCALVGFILAFGVPESRSSVPTDQWKTYIDTGSSPSIAVTCEGATFLSNSNFEGAVSLCPDSAENIYIKNATFGRTNSNEGDPTYCNFTQPYFKKTCSRIVVGTLIKQCQKSTVNGACSVTASNGVLGNNLPRWDPCPGVYKYLYNEYKCSTESIPGYTKLI